jgi:hypothetical protein
MATSVLSLLGWPVPQTTLSPHTTLATQAAFDTL